MKSILIVFIAAFLFSCSPKKGINKNGKHNLVFNQLASTWDEAMPLGNGMVGNLVWQKEEKLRFSLDRVDLWDLRPMGNIDFNKWKFKDVYQHWKDDTYEEVQQAFDTPYNQSPAPSKIPAGAIEFNVDSLGQVKSVELDVASATCVVLWESGARLTTFVHAEKPIGWYKFENLPTSVEIEMIAPAYNRPGDGKQVDQSMSDLDQLGYPQGEIKKEGNSFTYDQKGWGDFSYQIHTSWKQQGKNLTGCWSVSSANTGWEPAPSATENIAKALAISYDQDFTEHIAWWQNYWSRSAISIPDSVLEKQYYLEMYKFGSVARADAPPISLQAVWTADNGKLPPWKGDFHHDLNTQLSYWPSYAGNQLQLEEGFLNWLWKYRPAFKKYTKDYFETEGMNVPGVTTLEGEPMGGWIQYSMGQTVAAWLGHHFYMHWKFSMDRDFLENRAYPWLKDVAIFLDEVSVKGENDKRKLIMSSSPEIYNNSGDAWFAKTTNFDLALIRWTYEKAAELATELGLKEEAEKWSQILAEWTELSIDPETGLMFAPGFPYDESHRHFSHLLAYHPLGLLDVSKGEADKSVIDNTLRNLEKQGSGGWTGYSFSWQGNLYARAFEGEKAAEALRIFAECFCLKNSFHVNGDQCKAGHSNMTYRPFTLEGNFAFASGIQEMLIQSHTGVVRLFPAIPEDWNDVSFEQLRTYGAFVISANKANGLVQDVKIVSEKGGLLRMQNPFAGKFEMNKNYQFEGDNIVIEMQEGEVINLKSINL
ncbi:glycosyl hydrolase family 95 catalytic domain-containing protein [Sunxiuqinia sp. sy24]|uniref:glycosyl hydrolase family 95 catalytic domain-containing protein n=1 Tax=Sunxiuqinia sp. sy24 TaxID=3461495 RepID=UPI00404630D6